MATNKLAETLGQAIADKNRIKSSQINPGTIHSYFVFNNYRLKVRTTRCKVEYRDIGNAFILGHPTNGVLGTSELGAGTMGAWTEVETLYVTQEIPDVAKNAIAQWLKDGTGNPPSYMAFGTDGTAYTVDDTALGAEVSRNAVTTDITNDAKIIFTVELKSVDPIIGSTVREIGLFNASSGGTLFTRYVISDLATTNTKEYRFTIDMELFDDTIGKGVWTTAGLNEVRNWLGGSSATQPTYCAWGTGTTTPASTDTTLEGEVQRNVINISSVVDNVVTHETLLTTAQANGNAITKSGLFNASSGGTLFVENLYGAIQKSSLFQVHEIDRITVI